MRSVMVTKFLPLPADSGGKQRSLAVLTRLASLGEVVLCAFHEEDSDLAALATMGVEVRSVPWRPTVPHIARGVLHAWSASAARFWDADLAALVRTATTEAPTDVLQVEYATLAPYLAGAKATLRVLDLHNIESALVASYARSQSGLRSLPGWFETAAWRGLERHALGKVDVAAVVSEQDRRRLPPSRTEILKWRPNADAAVWFVNDVWPPVRARRPDTRLLLVGRSPGPRAAACRRRHHRDREPFPTCCRTSPSRGSRWPRCCPAVGPGSRCSRRSTSDDQWWLRRSVQRDWTISPAAARR